MATAGLIGYTDPALLSQADKPIVAPAATYTPTQTPGAVAATPAVAVQDPNKGTVSEQIRGLIAQNSPLMQQTETSVKQYAKSRGIDNSSMEAGAMQDAVIRNALSIAQSDAASNNQFGLINAANQQQANMTNADTSNKVNIVNTEAANQANQFGAQQQNALNTTQSQLTADTNKLNAQQANAMVMNNLDNASKVQLANITQQYSNTISANKSASDLFTAAMTQINNIQQSTTMNAVTKQTNVDQALQMLKASIGMVGSIVGLNLASTLDFSPIPKSV